MSLAEFLSEYGLFLLQLLTAIVLIVVIIGVFVVISRRGGADEPGSIKVEKLNDKFDQIRDPGRLSAFQERLGVAFV